MQQHRMGRYMATMTEQEAADLLEVRLPVLHTELEYSYTRRSEAVSQRQQSGILTESEARQLQIRLDEAYAVLKGQQNDYLPHAGYSAAGTEYSASAAAGSGDLQRENGDSATATATLDQPHIRRAVPALPQPPAAAANDSEAGLLVPCARHPNVETALRCGRCNTPICPKCMIMTPVGARCRDCAGIRPMAMYAVKPQDLLRGAAAGLASAVAAAFLFLLVLRSFIFFTSFIYGFIVSQAIEYASNRRRGPTMQITGVVCVIAGAFLALFLGGLLFGGGAAAGLVLMARVFAGDFFFFIFIIVASAIVWSRLS